MFFYKTDDLINWLLLDLFSFGIYFLITNKIFKKKIDLCN